MEKRKDVKMEKESIYKKREERRKETKDIFVIYAPKDKKREIELHAESRGEDVNAFCERAINITMELDKSILLPQKIPKEAKKRIRVRFDNGEKQRIKEHIQKTDETMSDFMYRSMLTTMELDDTLEAMERFESENGEI